MNTLQHMVSRRHVLIFTLIALALLLYPGNNTPLAEAGSASALGDLNITIRDFPLNNPVEFAQVNEQITFRIDYACGSTTNPCEDVYISTALPDDQFIVDFGSSNSGNAKIDLVDGGTFVDLGTGITMRRIVLQTGGGTLNCDNSPGDVCYLDGETSTATIVVRVRSDAYDQRVNYPILIDGWSNVTSDGDTPPVSPPDVNLVEDGIIDQPNFNWEVTKTRVLPPTSGTLDPALGEITRYQIQVCPTSNIDNWNLANLVIWDDVDDNLTVGDFVSLNGGVFVPNPGGPPPAPPSAHIAWVVGAADFTNGCVSRTVTLRYPNAAPFNTGGYIATNTATFDADYNSSAQSVCGPPCPPAQPGQIVSHPFDPPTATPNVNKGLNINPLGVNGTGRWRISPDMVNSNSSVNGFITIDAFPFQDAADANTVVDSVEAPLIMEGIRPGLWPQEAWFTGEVRATIRLSNAETCDTETALDPTTTSFAPNVVGTYNRQGRDITTPAVPRSIVTPPAPPAGTEWRCMRIDFTYDETGTGTFNPGVPMGFNVSGGGNSFEILFGVRGDDPALGNASYQNCADAIRYIGAAPANDPNAPVCATVNVTSMANNLSVGTNKSDNPGNPQPGDTVTFTLDLQLLSTSSEALVNPIIVDAFPLNILIDTSNNNWWTISYLNTDGGDVTLTQTDIINAGGVSVVERPIDLDGNPATNDPEQRRVVTFDLNGLNIQRSQTQTKTVRIAITGTVQDFTQDGTYTNISYFGLNDPGATSLVCESASPPTPADGNLEDIDDFFGDGDITDGDALCRETENYQVPITATLDGNKWLRNEDDPTNIVQSPGQTTAVCQDGQTFTVNGVSQPNYSRFGCVHVGEELDTFTYRLYVINVGNVNLFNYFLYDILPYAGATDVTGTNGDTGVSAGQVGTPRESAFRANMTPSGVQFVKSDVAATAPATTNTLTAGDFIIEYSTSNNPCRAEVDVNAACNAAPGWTATPAVWEDVRSFRIRTLNPTVILEPGARLEFLVEMQIPTAGTYAGLDDIAPGEIAWNNFAHVASYNDAGVQRLNPAEPRKVGIYVPAFGSIGNFVWYDTDNGVVADADYNNRVYDPANGEVGVPGVTVELYRDVDGDGNFTAADQAAGLVANTITGNPQTTDAGTKPGYYLFDNLLPGNYFVHIPGSNFDAPSDPLYNFQSSSDQGAPATDASPNNFDNGVDVVNPVLSGVTSPVITLSLDGSEPTGAADNSVADTSDDPNDGPNRRGNNNESDDNSDLTVDFGFIQAYDWGDNPDSYGTDATDGGEGVGPNHLIVPNLRMGDTVDHEVQGQPNAASNGDDNNGTPDDEDGVTLPQVVAGTTADVEVRVFNNTGAPATLVGWIDFSGDGIYQTGEGVSVTVPSSPVEQTIQLPFNVPAGAATGTSYARFRLSNAALTTSNPTQNGLTGIVNGEVEDYQVTILGPGIYINKTDGQNSIVVGQSTTYTVTIRNSDPGTCTTDLTDNLPIADPDGFDPASVSWTCNAAGGAACQHPSSADAQANDGENPWEINETGISIPQGGEIAYSINATLRQNATGANPIVNQADLAAGVNCMNTPASAQDIDGVIFDPPSGTKVGTFINGTTIRWTMTWINNGTAAQQAAVTDPIPAGQTFADALACQPFGTSSTDLNACQYNPGTNSVTWSGIIGPGNANRVEIAFNVTVPGNGTYNNIGAMVFTNPPPALLAQGQAALQATATGSVGIGAGAGGGDGGGTGGGDQPSGNQGPAGPQQPTISVQPLQNFISPGDPVDWLITVNNPTDQTLTGASIILTVPGNLNLLGAIANGGALTITDPSLVMALDPIPPGGTVTLTLNTAVIRNLLAQNVTLIVGLQLADGTIIFADGTVFRVPSELPATGASPLSRWRLPALLTLFAIVLAVSVGAKHIYVRSEIVRRTI